MKIIPGILRSIFVIFINTIFIFSAFAQDEDDIKELFLEAESYFLFEEYKDALPLYQKILQLDPENYNINYKIGVCFLDDAYQVDKSISYLEKAIKGTSSNYRINNYRERMAPLEAYYYLGNAYRVNNMLEDALEIYELFKQLLDPVVYDSELVESQIEACQVARALQSNPMYFTSSNLGATINEQFEEINPVISGDESVLVFTRKLQFYDAVFYSRNENGQWGYPINLTPSFAVDGNTYVTGISYHGDEIFVYRSDDFDGNIYVSKRINNQWSKLVKLNDNINTKYWESHASISEDGKTLYFTSNRRGGYGKLDIYKSERTVGGDWGPAINLGPVINTRYNEDTPFVTDQGKTLYFSSMGHYNMGGYDIFYSTKLDDSRWSIPVNVGYPLNSTNDDLFFVPTSDGAHAYYSSYDPEDSYGLADIYRMDVYTDLHPRKFILNGITRIEGDLIPDYTQHIATLMDLRTKKIIDRDTLGPDGTFTLDALSGELELQIAGKDISTVTERISIAANNPSDVITHTTTLTPAVKAEIPAVAAKDTIQPTLPQITAKTTLYYVTSDQSIPIELELDRNTDLVIETIVNGQLFKTEDFEIDQRRFLYMLKPFQGNNLLRFTITNAEGLSNTLEVTVNYTPEVEELAAAMPIDRRAVSDSSRYEDISSLAEGNLAKYLQILEQQEVQFSTIGELYDDLIAHGDEFDFTVDEVNSLMIRYLAQKNFEFFVEELKNHATDSVVATLDRLLEQSTDIYTPETLLDFLFHYTEQGSYTDEELREALYRIASTDRNPLLLIEVLQSYATENLASYLENMKLNISVIPDVPSIADLLIQGFEGGDFTVAELETALKRAAYEMDVDFLYLSLINISSDSLRSTLSDFNLIDQNVRNSSELISILINKSESGGYTRKELLENIEQIRNDPYYLIELFRDELAKRATGSLKIFLQEIDIRGLNIDTYNKLIDYLLRQSQYHEFNREMIYQLLIDIIDVSSTREFIDLLLRYADQRIISALYATDLELYSTPLEVVQYLLAASETYAYTERDILNLLLKIIFERKPLIYEPPVEKGWFSDLNKPALISTLIIVNTVIILLIIIYIFRRKQKRESQKSSK